ncbi:hypothetical protein MANES_12G139400v8 [Manihot esculenta]|uniref:Uncharacterized protein n=1 Tax=Manihot esculenta TaxID=3983 RepID=A0A2C9UXK4_MANES|nr:hypothetical protein MANES_12G139400v8 [Manihot esculenta]
MSSIGAAYAEVYLMGKLQKEKLKKAEEERRRRNSSTGSEEKKVSSSGLIRSNKKVHPGNYFPGAATSSAGNQGE